MDFINGLENTNLRKTIHLIRHGQTDYNRQNIIQGSGIDSDLNSTGIWQARKFHENYAHIRYDHVYTSLLKRAVQSVQPFLDSGIPHSKLKEFNEINWGIMEGRRADADNLNRFNSMVAEWSNGKLDIAVEGGETPLEMFERQKAGLKQLMSRYNEETVLICMHGRALRSFLCLLTGTPLNQMEKWNHVNLCLYELEWNGRIFEVIKNNDTSHLQEIS